MMPWKDPRQFKGFLFTSFNEELRLLLSKLAGKEMQELSWFSPIFIVARSGSGKSTFLRGLDDYLTKRGLRTHFMEGLHLYKETTEPTNSPCKHLLNIFPEEKIDEVDIFLLDDANYPIESKLVSRELLCFLDKILSKKKLIVLTSDKVPLLFGNKSLVTKIREGTLLQLPLFSSEHIAEYIPHFKESFGVSFKEEDELQIIKYLKSVYIDSLSSMKGVFKLLRFRGEATKEGGLDLVTVKAILKNYGFLRLLVEPNYIFEVTAEYYSLKSIKGFPSKKKDPKSVKAKHVAIFICKRLTGMNNKKIAAYFNISPNAVFLANKKTMTLFKEGGESFFDIQKILRIIDMNSGLNN